MQLPHPGPRARSAQLSDLVSASFQVTLIKMCLPAFQRLQRGVGGNEIWYLKLHDIPRGGAQREMGEEERKAWEGLDPNSSTVAKMS